MDKNEQKIETSQGLNQRIHKRSTKNILLSSALSCFISNFITNPLEVAKLQAQYSTVLCQQYPHPNLKELRNCQCTNKFTFRDMFKGLTVSLPHSIAMNMLYMTFYENLRIYFKEIVHNDTFVTLGSAIAARSMVSLLLLPVEVFRVAYTNSTVNNKIKMNTMGTKVTLLRDISYSALLWISVETVRQKLIGAEFREVKINPSQKFWFGSLVPAVIGSTIASLITTPLDTLKTRLQSGIDYERFGTISKQLLHIYETQRLTGLYYGVQHRLSRSVISTIIYLSLYEYFLQQFDKNSQKIQN